MDDDTPILRIDADAKEPTAMMSRLKDLPAEEQRRIREAGSVPGLQPGQLAAFLAAHPPLAVAVSVGPLPLAVRAIARIGAPPPVSRYMLVSAEHFDDEVLDRGHGIMFGYEMKHPDDDGEVAITIYEDGRFRRESASLGVKEGVQQFKGFYRNRTLRSGDILRRAASAPVVTLPGTGDARVVHLR